MNLYINNHSFHYELENLTRVFFPNEKITVINTQDKGFIAPYIYTEKNENITVTVCINDYKNTLTCQKSDADNKNELFMAQLLYKLLSDYSGINQPWGILTGVRPIKLLRRLIESDGAEKAEEYFRKQLYVSDKKTALAQKTEKIEKSIISLSTEKSFSLYISIPFCPTRCSYCSFVSQSVEKAKHLMQPYTELLCKELRYTSQIANELGLKLETVYMGGGTPTAITAEQLDMILTTVNKCFDLSTCREFTVEAGRPDTITEEKLSVILKNNADRISINPQTLNDSVLKTIGRQHTAQQSIDAYNLARKVGFEHINMDLIAGLPTDTVQSFKNTLDTVCSLEPKSVTVHTLSMKRSSDLTGQGVRLYKDDSIRACEMIDYSNEKLTQCAYLPYYLYRQSRMTGNLENTGWSKKGSEGLYNVYVMDETHTVLACGAGAVTKLKRYNSEQLVRIFNHKYPYEYNTRFDELMKRKDAIKEFYLK